MRSAMKTRTPIPEEIAASVLFGSDRTCCVCQTPGKPTQIHHVDEDPSNNDEANLCVLCLLCHDDTQVKGGFGRKLNAALVSQYRDNWCERVRKRRERADEIAISAVAGGIPARTDRAVEEEPPPSAVLVPFIESLPVALRRAYDIARPRWDSGVTAEMVEGTSNVIDVVAQMLVHLAAWYPARHFNGKSARDYFSEFIGSRAVWHRAVAEPAGVGTGGTIVSVMTGASLLSDLEDAVCDLVDGLLGFDDSFDFLSWKAAWAKAKEAPGE